MDYVREFVAPFGDAWRLFQGLDPDQQRSVLLLAALAAVALVVWIGYQAHGDRVIVVLPAAVLRIALLVLVLPFVLVGALAGRGTGVPGFLRQSWTAEPDPDKERIPVKTVNPMRLPGRLRARHPARRTEGARTQKTTRNKRRNNA